MALQMIITLAESPVGPHNRRRPKFLSGATDMIICNAIHITGGTRLPRRTEPLSLRPTRALAAILTAIAALFLSLLPLWPVHAASTPGEVRSGTLLLKGDGEVGTDATRLGIDVALTVSGPTP